MRINKIAKFFVFTALLLFSGAVLAKGEEPLKVVSSFRDSTLRVSDLYLQAVKEISIGDISNGYSILKEVNRQDSLHAPTLAMLSTMVKDRAQGLSYIKKAIEIDSSNVDYKYSYVNLLFNGNDAKELVAATKDLVESDHNQIRAHLYLVSAYQMTGQNFAAISAVDSAMVIFGENEYLLSIKQDILSKSKLYKQAIENGEKLVRVAPENPEYWASLAEVCGFDGKDSLALAYFAKGEAIDSQNVLLQTSKYIYYAARSDDNNSIKSLSNLFNNDRLEVDAKLGMLKNTLQNRAFYERNYTAIGTLFGVLRIKYPQSVEVKDSYTSYLVAGGDYKGALSVQEQVFKGQELGEENLKSLFYILHLQQLTEAPIDMDNYYVEYALENYPNDLDVTITIASLLMDEKHEKESIKVLKKFAKKCEADSTLAQLYGFIGDTYYKMGDNKSSFKYYDKSLKYDSENILVLNNYSYFLSENDTELEKALSMIQKVLAKSPDNPTYIDTYGWILYKLGEYERAKEQIRRAMALDTTQNPELLLHLGDIYYALKDKFSAQSYWNRALKAGADKQIIEERNTWE